MAQRAAATGILIALAWFLLAPASAGAATLQCFQFSQSGYSTNATVTGSFCGMDLNNDGWLADYSSPTTGEITAYAMSFSGNGVVPAFSHSLLDIATTGQNSTNGLVYRIGTPLLGDDNTPPFEGIGSGPLGGLSTLPGSSFAFRTGVGATSINAAFGFVEWDLNSPSGSILVGSDSTSNYVVVTAAPEPGTIAILGLGLTWLVFARRNRPADLRTTSQAKA